nr:ALPV-091 [Albatrosspox virus]
MFLTIYRIIKLLVLPTYKYYPFYLFLNVSYVVYDTRIAKLTIL